MKDQDWRWPNVRELIFEDLQILYEQSGPWDLVFFTGDLTQRGAQQEFEIVDEILEQLWELFADLGLDPTLLAVPGNHDLVRPDERHSATILLKNWDRNTEIRELFWEEPQSECRQIIEEAFENYVQWWQAQPHAASKVVSGMLPGDFSTTIEKEGAKLGIVGLNSAFLQLTDGDYEGNLVIHPRQFQKVCSGDGPQWAKEHHACLLLTHHPPTWLDAESKELFNTDIVAHGRFAVHLCGHMHDTAYRSVSEGGIDSRRVWQGRSLFGLEFFGEQTERSYGYSVGEMQLHGDTGSLRFWPRKYAIAGGEPDLIVDPDAGLDKTKTHTRLFAFKLQRDMGSGATVTSSKAQVPADLSDQAALPIAPSISQHKVKNDDNANWMEELPDTYYFIGRGEELQQLREALSSGSTKIILLRGLQDIGKKYLVSESLQRAVREGLISPRHVRVVDCARASSSGDLVQRLASQLQADLPQDAWDTGDEHDELLSTLLRCMQHEPFTIVLLHFEHLLTRTGAKRQRGFPIRDYWLECLLTDVLEKRHKSKLIIATTDEPRFRGSTTYLTRIASRGSHQVRGLDQQESKEFLAGRGIELGRADLRQMHSAIQGHPLALSWMDNLIQNGFSFSEIVEGELLSEVENLLSAIYDLCRIEAQEVLKCLSVLRQPVPIDAVLTMMGSLDVRQREEILDLLHYLRNKSLVFRSRDQHMHCPHSIVRLFCHPKIDEEKAKIYHERAAHWYRELDSKMESRQGRNAENISYAIEAHYHLEKADIRHGANKLLRKRMIPAWQKIAPKYFRSGSQLDAFAETILEAIDALSMSMDYNPEIKHEYGVECARYARLTLNSSEEKPSRVIHYLDEALRFAPDHMSLYRTYVAALEIARVEPQELGQRFENLETALRQQLEREPRNSEFVRHLSWVLMKWSNHVDGEEKLAFLRAAEQVFASHEVDSPNDYFFRVQAQSKRELAKYEGQLETRIELLESALHILDTGLKSRPQSRILIQDKATTLRQRYDLENKRELAVEGYDKAIEMLDALQVSAGYELRRSQELARLYASRAKRSTDPGEYFLFLSNAEDVLRTVKRDPQWGREDSILLADILLDLSKEGDLDHRKYIDEAIDMLRKELVRAPQDWGLLWKFSKASGQKSFQSEDGELEQIREAIQLVERALGQGSTKDHETADLFYNLAYLSRRRAYLEPDAEFASRCYDKAKRCLYNAIKRGKEQPDVYAELGQLYSQWAHIASSKAAYEKKMEFAERNYEKALGFATSAIPPWIHRSAAIFYRQRWNYSRAYELLSQFLQQESDMHTKSRSCGIFAETAIYHSRELEDKEKRRILQDARMHCEDAYSLLRDDQRFIVAFARILYELGDSRGTVEKLCDAFDCHPRLGQDVPAWQNEVLEIYEHAEEKWAKAMGSAPGDAMVWCALGTFLKDCCDDYVRAEKAYRNALFLDRDNVVILHNLGLLIMECGQPDRLAEADEYLEKGCSLSQGRFKWVHESLRRLRSMSEYRQGRNPKN